MKNADLLTRRQKAIPHGVATAAPIFIEYAENAMMRDVEGREYIDFAGGIAVLTSAIATRE
jgi:4-aminobutyrate aminotransferase/(S)-3-amino-2-methylpropionate transaminase